MQAFEYDVAQSPEHALALLRRDETRTRYIGGGTTLFDLMKLGVEAPAAVVDVTRLPGLRGIDSSSRQEVRIGALSLMGEVADHPVIRTEFPALSESLWKAASQQIRNMATLGGNLLQRTRCPYFRGGAEYACNKREPGSGCAALQGLNRGHAVLGGSPACVAVYPGDLAVALVALEAQIDVLGPGGARVVPASELHREPGDSPDRETTLQPGELIVRIRVPRTAMARRSVYHKVRDRESYAFALASAAVALDLRAGRAVDVRIGLGGLATRPWRAREAEQSLLGKPLTRSAARRAGELALASAVPLAHNRYKIPLGIETIADALMLAKERT